MKSKPIAFKSLYKPIFWFVILFIPLFINVILIPEKALYLFLILLIFYIPCTIYLIIKLKKPKILISQSGTSFVIHKKTEDIVISFDSIKSISSYTIHINNDIYIKTYSRKYRISDVRGANKVERNMINLLMEFKYESH